MRRIPTVLLPPRWHGYQRGAVDRTKPGLYQWDIEGVGTYIGKYTRIRRPEREYALNVLRLLNKWDYRKGKPTGFRRIHRELHRAHLAGTNITLTLLENVDPARLHAREMELIAERGSLNDPPFGRRPAREKKPVSGA